MNGTKKPPEKGNPRAILNDNFAFNDCAMGKLLELRCAIEQKFNSMEWHILTLS